MEEMEVFLLEGVIDEMRLFCSSFISVEDGEEFICNYLFKRIPQQYVVHGLRLKSLEITVSGEKIKVTINSQSENIFTIPNQQFT
tara:strand:- start:114 stop:368 length:255 start_codon:yes stop_codon:yes gene_type:complete